MISFLYSQGCHIVQVHVHILDMNDNTLIAFAILNIVNS